MIIDKRNREQKIDEEVAYAIHIINNELISANQKHQDTFNSDHEGYAVIKEELEEVWDEIKKDNHQLAREEMVQVAAMAVKFVYSSLMREGEV